MPKNNRKVTDLKGLNIYHDPKKGTILYDYLTKKGYQLTTSDIGKYSLSQAFLPVAVVLVYFLYNFVKLDMTRSIILSLIAYVIMRAAYRIFFLNKLPFIPNYKRPDGGKFLDNVTNNYSKLRLIIIAVLAFILIVVTVLFIILNKPTGAAKIGMYLLTLASIALFVFAIIAIIAKEKKK